MAALVFAEVPLRLDTQFEGHVDLAEGQVPSGSHQWTQMWLLDTKVLFW